MISSRYNKYKKVIAKKNTFVYNNSNRVARSYKALGTKLSLILSFFTLG